MSATYDVIVVGSGPGGYVTAIRGAQLGLRCAVVEREHLGGICLNWGCIPTKALLRSAEIYSGFRRPGNYGLFAEGTVGYDLQAVVKRSRTISAQLNGGIAALLKKNKVDVIWGVARVNKAPEGDTAGVVIVSERENGPAVIAPKGSLGPGSYHARHIIIATGARARTLPGVEPDKRLIWTYVDAMTPPSMPRSLVVVGSGAIGMEFATFYRALDCDVTVVEVMPEILPAEDAEIAALARKHFEKAGLKILSEASLVAVSKREDSIVATIDHKGSTLTVEAARLISAVGVTGNVEGLGLEEAGVELKAGTIVADGLGRTRVAGIYAIGDVAGPPMLAHKAEHEGVACVEAITGLHAHGIDKRRIPGCTYCHPQIASIGLTEKKARDAGLEITIGRFPFRGNGKALALGETEGLIKTIYSANDGRLIGAHLFGAEVTELVQGYAIAMQCGATQNDLINTIFPHPTLSEMIHESAMSASGRAIHI